MAECTTKELIEVIRGLTREVAAMRATDGGPRAGAPCPCQETQALILAELKETNDLLSNALMGGGLLLVNPPR